MFWLLPFLVFDCYSQRSRLPDMWRRIMLLLCSFLFVAGCFKLLHWEGANEILTVVMGGIAVFYPALSLANIHWPLAQHARNLFTSVLTITLLFKVMHWPGILYLAGCTLLLAVVWAFVYLLQALAAEEAK